MSVFQCKSGKHQGKWVCKYKNPDGKWITKYCASEEAARQKEIETLPEADEDTPYSLGDLAVLYLQANKRHKVTVAAIVNCLCGVGEFLCKKPAEELTRRDLETLRQNLRSAHGAKNSTLNLYQSRFRAILAWAVDQDLIPSNPWQHYKRLPQERRMVTVSYDDVKRVYEAAIPWLQWAIKTAYCLCLRPGRAELFSLKWAAFNWSSGTVVVKQGKSGHIKTVVPPAPYLAEARERYEEDLSDGIEYVCHKDGMPIYWYDQAWKRAVKKSGVKIRFYDVRHLAASEMLANGADLAAVAAQMGHASIAMTGQYYAHVMAGAQQRAAQALPLV